VIILVHQLLGCLIHLKNTHKLFYHKLNKNKIEFKNISIHIFNLYNNLMNTLLPELFCKLCDDIFRITDIRNLSRVCKKYNECCKEQYYIQKYRSLLFSKYLEIYSVEKYTVELILGECYNLLLVRYFNKNNDMICT